MNQWVQIQFRCLPLRSVAHFTPPVDASSEEIRLFENLRRAAEKHGLHNTYYLLDGKCVFHLTNDEQIGMLEFDFHGAVLTDSDDLHTHHCDLQVALRGEVCDWLVTPVVDWFTETVHRAVRVEFDRFIAAGDLEKTMQRMRQIEAESDARRGFLGMYL